MGLLNGTRTLLENKILVASSVLNTIKLAIEMGDEDIAIRLVAELAIYLVSIDKKCVAEEIYGSP